MAGGLGRTLGLGFSFGAKDDGAIRMTEDIGEGMENMTRAVRETGEESAGIQRLGNFINALNLSQLTRVSGALEGLADRAGALQGEISSTSLESHGAQFAQEYRAATAGLGEYSAEVDSVRGQISSLSFNLGVGSEGMLNYATSVARAGRSIEDYGLSMRDIAGLEQAGISNGQELAQTMTELDLGFGLGADGARRLADQVVAIGTRVGSGRDALIGMRGAVEAASEAISHLPEGVEVSIDQSVRGMTMLASASQRLLGGTFETAMQGAVGAFQRLAESRQQLGDVFTGMSSDFPELATGISRAFGSVDSALNSMMQSPEQFVMEMQSMYEGMDNAARTRFQREVLTEFPESIRYMILAGEEGRRQMEELVGPVGDAEGALSDMAQGASGSTRTFAESMDLLNERFQHQMNSTVRSMPGYENFERRVLERQRQAYDRLGGAIQRLSNERTGLGALTRVFRAFSRGGFQGLMISLGVESNRALNSIQESATDASPALGNLIGSLRETGRRAAQSIPWLGAMGDSIFDIAGQALPAATGLGAMGLKFDHIGKGLMFVARAMGPFALLIGLGVGIYYLSRNLDRVKESLRGAAIDFRDFGYSIETLVSRVDWAQLGVDLVDGVLGAFSSLAGVGEGREMSETAQAIADGFRSLFGAVVQVVVGLAYGMWTRIVQWIMEPPDIESQVRRAGAAAGVSVGGALAVGMISPLRSSIVGAFRTVFSGIGRFLTGGRALGGGALRTILRRIPYIGAIVGVLFDLPQIIESFQTGSIIDGFRTLFGSIVNGLLFGVPEMLEGALGGVDITGGLFDFLMDLFNIEEIVGYFQSGQILRGIMEAIMSMPGANLVRMLMERIVGEDVVTEYLDGMTELWRGIGGELQEAFNQWLGYLTPLFDEWMAVFGEIGGVLGELWDDTLAPLLEDILGFSLTTEGVGGAFDDAQGGVQGFGDLLTRVLDTIMPAIQWIHRTAMPLVVDGFRLFADAIRGVVAAVRFLWNGAQTVYPYIVSAIELVVASVQTWWGAINFLWSRVIRPVLGLVMRLFRSVLGFILSRWLRTFRTIGSIVNWLWDRVVSPVFQRVWNLWSWVMDNIISAVRSAFNFVRRFITERIENAALAFRILGTTWNETKAVLAAGFRYIAAEVNRYIIVPFLRVRNTMGTLAEAMTVAFLRVKQTLVSLFRDVLRGLQSFLREIPGIGEDIAVGLNQPIADIGTNITEIGIEIDRVQRRASQSRQQNYERIAEAETRSATARTELIAAEQERQRAMAAARAEETQRRAAQRAGERSDDAPTRRATPARPGAAPTPVATPVTPSAEEQTQDVRRSASRREGAVQGEQQRAAQEVADEMGIEGFSGQAKRDLTEVIRAAMGNRGRRGGGRTGVVQPNASELQGGSY